MQLLHRIQPEYPQVLTTLSMDIKKRFLLAGSSQGMIYIYELGKPGKVGNGSINDFKGKC